MHTNLIRSDAVKAAEAALTEAIQLCERSLELVKTIQVRGDFSAEVGQDSALGEIDDAWDSLKRARLELPLGV